ncbi:ParA family protein [uncultured Phascolarctobacterium sp.]|uniref:ParA family protein n=1 Tax=uncultured Phascolarctobacterium sp. TaxID=512296 RepID=UPI0026308303|nr:ParA family protein [uncultured Phascolarctobacterium sp.]
MTKTISFNIQKGGVAKTTSAVITAEILQQRGYDVLLVDFDPQRNLTHGLAVDKPKCPVADVLTGKTNIKDAILRTEAGLGLLPADRSLFALQAALESNALAKVLAPVSGYFDYVIIDTAPALSSLSVNALVASDLVVIPAVLGDFCDLAIRDVLNTIDIVRQQNKKLAVAGILITMSKKRYVLDRLVAEQYQRLADSKHIRLFTSKIRQCQKVKEAQMLKISLLEYAPRCNAALDYRNFVNELLEL